MRTDPGPPTGEAMTWGNSAHRFLDVHLERGNGDAVCVRTERQTVSYQELSQRAGRAANAFADAGVGHQDRVALILPDSVDHLSCLLGLLRLGAIPVPLTTQLTVDDYARILADCRPSVTVTGPGLFGTVRSAAAAAGCPDPWLAEPAGTERQPGGPPPGEGAVTRLSDRLDAASTDRPLRRTDPEDTAVILYTSGSSGVPRGVVHTHRGLLAVLEGVPAFLELTPADLCFSAPKLSFAYGFGNSFLFPLSAGASTLLMPEVADAPHVLRLAMLRRPTLLFAVPTLYSAMLQVAEREPSVDLSSVRTYICGGEPLPRSLADRWRERFGRDLVSCLGSTEALHTYLACRPGITPPDSSGTLLPNYQGELRDEQGEVVGFDQVGQLWIKGRAIASHYWNRPEETASTMVDGWLRTGDQLHQDPAGAFYYIARTDDVLKVGGHKVAPTEIEDCLLRHPTVRECAVIGVPGQHATTEIVAYVRLRQPATDPTATRRALRKHVHEHLAAFKRPRTFHLVEELPRTTTGKIARQLLRNPASHQGADRR